MILLVMLVLINPNPLDYTRSVTITVSEKYAQHEYRSMCGKYPCTQTENAKIVDTDGNLWNIQDETVWASMKLNGTYTLTVGTLPTDQGKVYSATPST
jgi:hypothetical protein